MFPGGMKRQAPVAALLLLACAPAKQAWSEAAPARPEVFLDVLPRSAVVLVDGEVAGQGPLTVRVPEGGALVAVSAPGFDAQRLTLGPRQGGGRVAVALRPVGFGGGRELGADDAGGLAAAGSWLLRAGKPLEAAGYAERAVDVSPSTPEGHRVLGLSLARLGRRGPAAQELSTYLQLSPSAPDRQEIEILVTRLRGDINIPEPR